MNTSRLILATICVALVNVSDAADQSSQSSSTPAQAPAVAQPAAREPVRTTQPARPAAAKAPDRLDLDATVVTGNRELPKVLYIVPWKKAEIGDLPEQPFNTLLDEALAPLDRDEFRREVAYFSKLSDRSSAGGGGLPQPAPAVKPSAP